MVLRLATRPSQLAIKQTQIVADLLTARDPSLRIVMVEISSRGDLEADVPLTQLATGEGVFTSAVEQALIDGRADAAVHSLKDVPTDLRPGLLLAAFPSRGSPHDVLVARQALTLQSLPAGAIIGTSSPRRAAQILAARPELRVEPIRGNVDSRLRKLRDGQFDAIILAAAGLERLNPDVEAATPLPIDRFLPAAGQGALVVQCRAEDRASVERLRQIDHYETRIAVLAERAFLQAVGGGCRLPVGAFAELRGVQIELRGFLAAEDGSHTSFQRITGPSAEYEALALDLAARMRGLVPDEPLLRLGGGLG